MVADDGDFSHHVTKAEVSRDMDASEQRAQRRVAQNESLDASRTEMNRQKSIDSLKRFSYLLGQTELFQHFIDMKKDRDPEFARLLDESTQKRGKNKGGKNQGKSKGDAASDQRHHRKTEKEEDEELMQDENDDDEDNVFMFRESPGYVEGGTMKDYQIQGLNWLISLYHNGINGILADEMGLGKTLQTISFLGYLKHYRNTPGLHLVVVPKSTLDNWVREFHKWVPGLRIVTLQGSKEERHALIHECILPQAFDVLVTTYEMCLREKPTLQKLSWEYIVIDEAHRIKNVDSALSQIVRAFTSRSRLLITGTPLQNNLMELWSLLNFLLPDVFSSADDFEAWFQRKGDTSTETSQADDAGTIEAKPKDDHDDDADRHGSIVQQLHKVLRPFLLRRVKADVEQSLLPKKEINVFVGLSDMQRKWYKSLLEKDIEAVNGALSKKEGKTRLLNIVMQLRKCCNHPYLFDGAEPGPPYTTDEHLVYNSGKMDILDKLLRKMKERGSRVLIFCQMSRMLDILEDYCLFREYTYCRIDGSSVHEDRIAAIDEYNRPDSDKFLFLLTTRAGGLGINLTSADVVVLFDSDWNPQADLQAMDRAHRIGQKKQVFVYRFVTDHSIEERILERAAQKLRLDQLVIQQGRSSSAQQKAGQMKEDLVDMIQHGAERIINSKESMDVKDDIDAIIAQGESRTAELQAKYQQFTSLDELTNLKSESAYEWEGEQYKGRKPGVGTGIWIEPAKRERKQNYSIDSYYRDAMRTTSKPAVPKAPRAPKQVSTPEWQFYPARFIELQERETAAYQRSLHYQVPKPESSDPAAAEEQRAKEQARIDAAEPLTEAEQAEKDELAPQGMSAWNRRDFQQFVKGCEKHGRTAYGAIAEEIGLGDKTEDDVRAYSEVFWARVHELSDGERIVQRIEEGEAKRRKQQEHESLLRRKVDAYAAPLEQLKISYNQAKGKAYSEDEDRFLLVRLADYGLHADDVYERIRADVLAYPEFRFNWFIKSRTPQELARRCHTLLLLVIKEEEDREAAAANASKTRKKRNAPEARGSPRPSSRARRS